MRMDAISTGLQPGAASAPARLCAIVAVSETNRVRCQEVGCGRPVFASVHIVEDGGQLLVLGSRCFEKRYGTGSALGAPVHGSGSGTGRRLSDAERLLLEENTQALLEQFRQEELAMARIAPSLPVSSAGLSPYRKQQASFGAAAPVLPLAGSPFRLQVPALTPAGPSPWPWQKPRSSILLMQAPSGDRWIRVQHLDGSQKIVPWPTFPGWEVALPPGIGLPNQVLGAMDVADIVQALGVLRAMGFKEQLGTYKDVLGRRSYEI